MSDITPGLVSVIVPCYRQAHFLAAAVDSALAQTYLDVEVIVVDDGSPDDAARVAARYAAQGAPVRCVRQPNRGLAAARNAGIRESKGEFLVFLDADDCLRPEALAIGVESLRARAECAFVCGQCDVIAQDGSIQPPYAGQLEAGDNVHLALLRHGPIYVMTVMFRRRALDKVGLFDVSNSPAADCDLYYRIAREFPVYAHGQIIASYRRHGENMTGDIGRMLAANVSALRGQRKYVRKDPELRQAYLQGIRFWQRRYGDLLAHDVRLHVRRGEWRPALRGLRLLLRYHPRAVWWNVGGKLINVLRGGGKEERVEEREVA